MYDGLWYGFDSGGLGVLCDMNGDDMKVIWRDIGVMCYDMDVIWVWLLGVNVAWPFTNVMWYQGYATWYGVMSHERDVKSYLGGMMWNGVMCVM